MSRKRYKPEEIIAKLREAEVLIERWRRHYNTVRPHSSLGYKPPAPQTILPKPPPPPYDPTVRTLPVQLDQS